MKYSILVVDEDVEFVKAISQRLEENSYEVHVEDNCQKALKRIDIKIINLIIISCEIIEISNFEILKKIREKYTMPIILLSKYNNEERRIRGIELGADDYLTKPININDLMLSVKALLRRTYEYENNSNSIISKKEIVINASTRKVNVYGKSIELTSKEYDILFLLITNPGKIYNRETLLEIIWGYDYYGDARTVDVHVRRLREKIEKDPANPAYIITKWGVGYYFKE